MSRDTRWISHAESAADLALQAGHDHTAAVILYEVLTAVEHPVDRRVAVACKLGEAAAWGAAALGDLGPRVIDALRTVLAADVPPTGRGEIRLFLGRLLLQLGRFDEAVAEIEAAMADLPTRPDLVARAMTLMAYPRGQDWPAARHRAWLDRAAEPTSRVMSPETRLSLAVDRTSALLMLGDAEGWREADGIAAADNDDLPLPERRQVARGLMNIGHLGIAWGRHQESRDRLDRAVALMRTTRYERLLNSAELTLAHLDWHEGAWDGLAERVAALSAAEQTLPEAGLEAHLVLGLLALGAGHRNAAEERFRQVLDEATRRGLVDVQTAPAAALGRLLLADGEPDQALAVTGPVVERVRATDIWIWATDVLVSHVDALVRLGRTAEAARWVDRFRSGLADRPAPAAQAAVLVASAITADALGDPARAADLLSGAAHAWAAIPRPYDELLAIERRAMLFVGGRGSAAAVGDADALGGVAEGGKPLDTLATVQHRLMALGAVWDADRVARVLRRRGVEVARTWRGGRRGYGDRLSPRELEVVRLVAGGRTNRKVAEMLFLSTRTVDRHLSAAMRKLGVTSRTALAVAAHDAGLLGGHHDDDATSSSSFG